MKTDNMEFDRRIALEYLARLEDSIEDFLYCTDQEIGSEIYYGVIIEAIETTIKIIEEREIE